MRYNCTNRETDRRFRIKEYVDSMTKTVINIVVLYSLTVNNLSVSHRVKFRTNAWKLLMSVAFQMRVVSSGDAHCQINQKAVIVIIR
jgi:hypothetical protein